MFKKSIVLVLTLSIVMSLLVGCGGEEPNGNEESNEEAYEISLAYVVPETQSTHIAAAEVFKPYVEEQSEGRIKVNLFPNGQLGGDRQAIEGVQMGTIDMTIPAAAVLSGFEEKFQIFDLPFLFSSKGEVYEALDGELGSTLSDLLVPLGLRNLAYGENGFRHITNDEGPITQPSDLEGLKIRTMENPVHMETFRELGANPTPVSFGELYTALQQGTVDAQENPIPLVYTSKFYEVQDYYSLTGHVYAATVVLINEELFQGMPEDLQNIIIEGAELYRDEQRKLSSQQDEEMLDELRNEGMEINELTNEEKQVFIDATEPVYEEFEDIIGSELMDLIR
jgi:tripartite ATP-independent transporter DctP family solute receptor